MWIRLWASSLGSLLHWKKCDPGKKDCTVKGNSTFRCVGCIPQRWADTNQAQKHKVDLWIRLGMLQLGHASENIFLIFAQQHISSKLLLYPSCQPRTWNSEYQLWRHWNVFYKAINIEKRRKLNFISTIW